MNQLMESLVIQPRKIQQLGKVPIIVWPTSFQHCWESLLIGTNNLNKRTVLKISGSTWCSFLTTTPTMLSTMRPLGISWKRSNLHMEAKSTMTNTPREFQLQYLSILKMVTNTIQAWYSSQEAMQLMKLFLLQKFCKISLSDLDNLLLKRKNWFNLF